MGKEDKFDLALAPSELLPRAKPEEKKEDVRDIQISEGKHCVCVRESFDEVLFFLGGGGGLDLDVNIVVFTIIDCFTVRQCSMNKGSNCEGK